MNREKRKLVRTRTDAILNSDRSFGSIYKVIVSEKDRIFCQYDDRKAGSEKDGIVKLTYGKMDENVRKYAAFIKNNTDARGEFIGLESENCASWVYGFWGILMSGNKPFLMNCRHPENFRREMAGTLNVRYVIGKRKPDTYPLTYFEYDTIENSESREPEISDHIDFGDFGDEIALATSATSLDQVICVYSGREMTESILNAEYILKNNRRVPAYYEGALRQLAFVPFYHIFGFSAVYMWFAFYGCTMVFLEDYSGETIMKTIRKHKVTHVFAVPLFWQTAEALIWKKVRAEGTEAEKKFRKGLEISENIQKKLPYAGERFARRLLKQVGDKTFGRSVRFCISGGSYIKDSTLKLFNALGYPIHNGYGMTETGITSVNLEKTIDGRNSGTAGHPFPSVEYITDEEGELTIRGTSLCKYRIVNGIKKDIGGEWKTGDLVEKKESGYVILGRRGDTIIGADGENVNPDMLEKNFNVPFLQRYCIISEEGQDGEYPVMVVELNKMSTSARIKGTVEELEAQNRALSPSYKMRKIYYTFDLISSPDAVKISRKYLKNGISNGTIRLRLPEELEQREKPGDFDDTTELARIIKKIIKEALDIDEAEIRPDANVITDLGGSSLDYFCILSKIKEETGVSLYAGEADCPYTLREFCEKTGEQL